MSGRRSPRVFIAIAALALSLGAAPANAEGLFEFLFGKIGGAGQQASLPAPTAAPSASRPLSLTVRPRATGLGSGIAFCVRMCDGRYFPMQRSANVQPGQVCNSLCPASKTKVFAGPDIALSIAADGSRYSALDSAFLYREETVEDCTCNGRTSYGLAVMDAREDPTLRAGDLVATYGGLIRSVAKSREAKRDGNDNEVTTSALPLGLRKSVSDKETVQFSDVATSTAPEITKPAMQVSRPKRFHNMFAQRKRTRQAR